MLMEQKLEIIIDETNTTIARRASIIKLAKEHGYQVRGVWVNRSKEVCIVRAEAENQLNLVEVISKMNEQFENPTTDEGFDTITIL